MVGYPSVVTLERRTPLQRRTPLARGTGELRRTPLAPRSAKRQAIAPERAAFVDVILRRRQYCEFLWAVQTSVVTHRRIEGRIHAVLDGADGELWVVPPCLWLPDITEPGRATDVHEIVSRGRGGAIVPSQGLTDVEVIALCSSHHIDTIHGNPRHAKALGLLTSNPESVR